jgi:hypothetical protein
MTACEHGSICCICPCRGLVVEVASIADLVDGQLAMLAASIPVIALYVILFIWT